MKITTFPCGKAGNEKSNGEKALCFHNINYTSDCHDFGKDFQPIFIHLEKIYQFSIFISGRLPLFITL